MQTGEKPIVQLVNIIGRSAGHFPAKSKQYEE
jgi:hypothetical protein